MQVAAKEILKKCERAVGDHRVYIDKYNTCTSWLLAIQEKFNSSSGADEDLAAIERKIQVMAEILSQQQHGISCYNRVLEMGEKLYVTTAVEGREVVRIQMQELQTAIESFYDGVSSCERELQAKRSRWMNFESASEMLRKWLTETEQQHPQAVCLRATLDEKRAQLTTYRTLLQDVLAHQQAIFDCRDRAEILPESGIKEDRTKVDSFIGMATKKHQELLKRAQSFVENYESIVSDHQQYSKAVMDAQEWLDATHGAIEMWGDGRLERITIHANLERLKNLQIALPEEESRIQQIRILGEKTFNIQPTIQSISFSLISLRFIKFIKYTFDS